jgi:hypothetical protein
MLGDDPNDPDMKDTIVMLGCVIATVVTVFLLVGGVI